jgi:16S rRNA (adenine(1408)-N(1))-methyltransferase
MADASRRAARPPMKGGLPNALFVVASAETPPAALAGRVRELTVQFPWASLLRGTLALDDAVATGIAGLLAPAGRMTALVAPAARDGLAGLPTTADLLDGAAPALAARWLAHGVVLTDLREATAAEVAASGSTWAKRLLAGRSAAARPVAHLTLRPTSGDRR